MTERICSAGGWSVLPFFLLLKHCFGAIPDRFLVVAETNGIESRWLNGTNCSTVPFLSVFEPQAVDYSASERAVYWTAKKNVGRADLETGMFVVLASLTPTAHDLKGIAVDWTTGNIYYSYSASQTLHVAVLDKTGMYHTVILAVINAYPGAIALEPSSSYMYLASERNGRILKASMSGGKETTLYQHPGHGFLTGLVVDSQNQQIYWVVAGISGLGDSMIGRSNINGEMVIEILVRLPGEVQFSGIALTGRHLIVTWWNSSGDGDSNNCGKIEHFNFSDYRLHRIAMVSQRILDVAVYNAMRIQEGSNNCSRKNGGCQELCLLDPISGHKCGCSSGLFAVDGQYCVASTPPPEGTIRLNGSEQWQGLVQIYHNGQWGTVCGDSLDSNAAVVVCRQLGRGDKTRSKISRELALSSGPIWLDSLHCSGDEDRLDQCEISTWESSTCHTFDVGVICGSFQSTTEPTDPGPKDSSSVPTVVIVAVCVPVGVIMVVTLAVILCCRSKGSRSSLNVVRNTWEHQEPATLETVVSRSEADEKERKVPTDIVESNTEYDRRTVVSGSAV